MANKKSKQDNDKKNNRHNFSWVEELRAGRSISIEFFKKNAWLLLLITVAVIAMIGLRYETKTKMSKIKSLPTELQRAESRKLQETSLYLAVIRETEMKRLVHEKGLALEFQEQPPYEITDN